MKARLSHCISRLLPFAAAMLVCAGAQAQISRYDRLERRNLWNAGENVAALRLDSLSFAEAALGARYEAGAFRSMSDASSLWGAGVLARAVSTLEGFSMRGSFGFENTEDYDMCGSMFMQPGFFPVDVMEFTPGRKSFQKYTLSGGIAVPLSDHWTVGADMDFASANAAKRKDLRYTGYRLDFSFAPSLLYSSGPFSAGLSLLYGRNTEKIDAEAGYATVVKADSYGFNFTFAGSVIGGKYNTVTVDETKAPDHEEWYGANAMNYVLASTGYTGSKPQMFSLMSSFTKTFPEGKLSVAYTNLDNGVQVRCVLDRQ